MATTSNTTHNNTTQSIFFEDIIKDEMLRKEIEDEMYKIKIPYNNCFELNVTDTLIECSSGMKQLLSTYQVTFHQVLNYYLGIYERSNTMEILNITGLVDKIYHLDIARCLTYRDVLKCPFCKEKNYKGEILHSRTHVIENTINKRRMYIGMMQIHMLIDHHFMAPILLAELIDVMDIENILCYKEPTYTIEYRFMPKKISTFDSQSNAMYQEILKNLAFANYEFTNGQVGYLFPRQFDVNIIYHQIIGNPTIQDIICKNIGSNYQQDNYSRLNAFYNDPTSKLKYELYCQCKKLSWYKVAQLLLEETISFIDFKLKHCLSWTSIEDINTEIDTVINQENFISTVQSEYKKMLGLKTHNFNDMWLLLSNPVSKPYSEECTRTECVDKDGKIRFFNTGYSTEIWYKCEKVKMMNLI